MKEIINNIDDTLRFFDDLKKGESISVIIAPAFKANYPNEYEKVLGGLKKTWSQKIYQCFLWCGHYDLGLY